MSKEKAHLGAVDIKVLIDELRWIATAKARIQKIYQFENEAHLEIYVAGRGTFLLILGDGKFFLTQKRFKYPEAAPPFAMTLRKHLSGKKIVALRQHDFDRVVILEIDGFKLIGELLPKGNVILTDAGDNILAVISPKYWAARKLKIKAKYAYPPPRENILEMEATEVKEKVLAKEKRKLVVWLADFFGGTYAEEICARAGVEKDTPCNNLAGDDALKVKKVILDFLESSIVPEIIYKEGVPIDITPFSLSIYRGAEKKIFPTFNEAVEEYFAHRIEIEERRLEEEMAKKEKEERAKRAAAQKEAIKRLYAEQGENTVKAQRIAENYLELGRLIEAAQKNLKDAQRLSPKITAVDEKGRTFTINLGEPPIPAKIHIDRTVWQNVEAYYAAAKKAKEKVKGVEAALAKAEAEAKKRPLLRSPAALKKEKRPKAWYESFRWFKSSEGLLVVSGKDAATNEIVVKKHAAPQDVVLHTEAPGSPFTVIKVEGKTPGDATLAQAAQFTATYSRAWKTGVGRADVFWVKPEQLSKKAPSGEFIASGSFMVYGERNWIAVELAQAIGLTENEIVAGPVDAVAAQTKNYVTVTPGKRGAKDLAKEIKAALFSRAAKAQQEWLRSYPEAEIARHVPFGVGEIKK